MFSRHSDGPKLRFHIRETVGLFEDHRRLRDDVFVYFVNAGETDGGCRCRQVPREEVPVPGVHMLDRRVGVLFYVCASVTPRDFGPVAL